MNAKRLQDPNRQRQIVLVENRQRDLRLRPLGRSAARPLERDVPNPHESATAA